MEKSMRTQTRKPPPPSRSGKPPVETRPLITADQAQQLGGLFKVLANPTRLALLHALVRQSDLCVTEIADTIGVKTTAVSNQLQRLVDQGILASRRNGNNIHYHIVDPCVTELLDTGWCLAEDAAVRRGQPQ